MIQSPAPPIPHPLDFVPVADRNDVLAPKFLDTNRSIYNPIQRDRVTFIETADETRGARTLVEVELAPGGGNQLHYHRSYSERFTPIVGDLDVQIGKEKRTLLPGKSALVERGVPHRFYNAADEPIRFQVEIAPGSRGFEQSLHIAYGMAREGQMNAAGVPKNPFALGLLVELSDTQMVGPLALLAPLFGFLANQGRQRGLDAYLLRRYAPQTIESRGK